jgi:hypothetical protein
MAGTGAGSDTGAGNTGSDQGDSTRTGAGVGGTTGGCVAGDLADDAGSRETVTSGVRCDAGLSAGGSGEGLAIGVGAIAGVGASAGAGTTAGGSATARAFRIGGALAGGPRTAFHSCGVAGTRATTNGGGSGLAGSAGGPSLCTGPGTIAVSWHTAQRTDFPAWLSSTLKWCPDGQRKRIVIVPSV